MSVRWPDIDGLIVPMDLFPGQLREVWLEIGCGAGEHLLAWAVCRPDVGFLACEPFVNGIAAMLSRMRELDVDDRVRVHADDARPLLQRLADACIERVFILFADPWPKRRHHRRRLMQTDTVQQMVRILKPGGELLFASDHMEYVRWTLAILTDNRGLYNDVPEAEDTGDPPIGWLGTRYERKALARGDRCFYLRFRRRSPNPDAQDY